MRWGAVVRTGGTRPAEPRTFDTRPLTWGFVRTWAATRHPG